MSLQKIKRWCFMPRHSDKRHTIPVLFTNEEYENIKKYAALSDKSMSTVIREFTNKGLTGELTENNIDFLTPIIRAQLKSIMDIQYERLASMTAKTCIQAGTAAYLSAEALNSFVPIQYQRSFLDAYESARKKALQYLRANSEVNTATTDIEK